MLVVLIVEKYDAEQALQLLILCRDYAERALLQT